MAWEAFFLHFAAGLQGFDPLIARDPGRPPSEVACGLPLQMMINRLANRSVQSPREATSLLESQQSWDHPLPRRGIGAEGHSRPKPKLNGHCN
jgi:hypothetical protein